MSDDQIEDVVFTCPECGSHHFGSHERPATTPWELACPPSERMEGICHGYIQTPSASRMFHGQQRPCGFRWLRKDDVKYFKGTGAFRPRTVMGKAP